MVVVKFQNPTETGTCADGQLCIVNNLNATIDYEGMLDFKKILPLCDPQSPNLALFFFILACTKRWPRESHDHDLIFLWSLTIFSSVWLIFS